LEKTNDVIFRASVKIPFASIHWRQVESQQNNTMQMLEKMPLHLLHFHSVSG